MKPKNRIYCPQCNRLKLQFETKAKAENFIRFNAEDIKDASGFAPTRAYYCTACCAWHVTSHEKHHGSFSKEPIDHALVRRSKHHLNAPGEPYEETPRISA